VFVGGKGWRDGERAGQARARADARVVKVEGRFMVVSLS
jgi:hypothetical protein